MKFNRINTNPSGVIKVVHLENDILTLKLFTVIDESLDVDGNPVVAADFTTNTDASIVKHPSIADKFLLLSNDIRLDLSNLGDLPLDTNNHIALGGSQFGKLTAYNINKETYIGKERDDFTRAFNSINTYGVLFKKYIDDAEFEFLQVFSSEDELFSNVTFNALAEYEEVSLVGVSLSGADTITADAIGEYSVQLVDGSNAPISKAGVEVYLKTNAGVLSHRKVLTDANGVAGFKIKSEMLAAGEIIEIKAGFKYFTNINSKEITVN